jgi:hypothetical protein
MQKFETRVAVDGFVFRNLKKDTAFNLKFDFNIFF